MTISYTVALTVGSLVKPVELDLKVNHVDKVVHFGAYGGLAFLWVTWYHLSKRTRLQVWLPIKKYASVAVFLIFYGILIEVLQGVATDYRTPDIWDVLANTLGVMLGSAMFMLFFKKFNRLKTIN